jgi:outer membrane protein
MRLLHRITICILLVLVQLPLIHAQTSIDLTADESVRIGLEHNVRIRIANAETDEARYALREVRAAQFPSVRGQASYTRISDNVPEVEFSVPGIDTTFTFLPVELNRYYSELSVEQPLFAGFRIRNQVRAAGYQAEATALMGEQEQADVAFAIRRAYWNLYQAIAIRESVDAALMQVDEHLKDVQNRVDAGTALTTDYLNARTRRSEVLLEQIEANSAVRMAQLELSRLIGMPFDSNIHPVAPEESEALPARPEPSVEDALGQRPQIRAMEKQIDGLGARVNMTRGLWFPELYLVGRYIYARPNQYFFLEQDRFKASWEIGLALRWSLFEGGSRIAQTNRARTRLKIAEERLTDIREQVSVEMARQHLELQRAAEAIRVAEENIGGTEEALRMARKQYEEGVALSSHVLDAEFALRAARARQVRAVAEYAVARAAVLNVLGQVWE